MSGIAKEVKVEIISKVKSGTPVLKLSEEYGVSDKIIYNWLKAGVEHSASALELVKIRRENDQLKQIIGVLTLELEKTKKNRADIIRLITAKLPLISKKLLCCLFGRSRASLYYCPTREEQDIGR
ncbi:MAG: hypothetical protein BWY19_01184 [bacterium ADurb.Bin212]|nr:MAG: hypothetical protein BWY19_01184 [bacterium ADurb.Bin212]